jgi:polysaccharide biosynthesis transport protein
MHFLRGSALCVALPARRDPIHAPHPRHDRTPSPPSVFWSRGMSPEQALAALRAHAWLALGVVAAVLAAVLGAAVLTPPRFEATASAVVEARADPLAGAVAPAMAATMATQTEIVRSERVARRAAQSLGLLARPDWRERWQRETGGSVAIDRWLALRLVEDSDVRPVRDSSVLTVRAAAATPEGAAELANALMQAYLDTTIELRVEQARRYGAFFEPRALAARATLEQAQAKLSAHMRDKGLVAGDERLDVESLRLNELSSQLTALQATHAGAAGRQAAASGQQADRLQEVLTNPALAQIASEVARAQALLQRLDTRLGERHPQVQEAQAQLAELRLRQDAETRRVAGGVGLSGALVRQREAELRAAVERQRERVLALKAARDSGQLLQREVEQAQRAFDGVQQRLAQAELESHATHAQAQVLAPALPPLKPAAPRLPLLALLALVLGSILGVAAALAKGWREQRRQAMPQPATPGHGLAVVPGPASKAA